MNESTLTQLLVENLQKGAIKKIAKGQQGKKIELRREVGNNSFRADIFITLQGASESIGTELNDAMSFIAIEVKIKDWKQGFYQAWRYNSFAEKSYLAIYEPYSKNVDITLFEKHNVGLIVFNEESVIIMNQPKKNTFLKRDSYSTDLREKIWQSLPAVKCVQPVF